MVNVTNEKNIDPNIMPYNLLLEKIATNNNIDNKVRQHQMNIQQQLSLQQNNFPENYDIQSQGGAGSRFLCTYPDCGKSFSRKSRLKAHLHLHWGTQPFRCEYPGCTKAFSERPNLIIHNRIHTKEKPFSCKMCGKKFTTKGNMKDHERRHFKQKYEKPYSCETCGFTFYRKNILNKHEQNCKISDEEQQFLINNEFMNDQLGLCFSNLSNPMHSQQIIALNNQKCIQDQSGIEINSLQTINPQLSTPQLLIDQNPLSSLQAVQNPHQITNQQSQLREYKVQSIGPTPNLIQPQGIMQSTGQTLQNQGGGVSFASQPIQQSLHQNIASSGNHLQSYQGNQQMNPTIQAPNQILYYNNISNQQNGQQYNTPSQMIFNSQPMQCFPSNGMLQYQMLAQPHCGGNQTQLSQSQVISSLPQSQLFVSQAPLQQRILPNNYANSQQLPYYSGYPIQSLISPYSRQVPQSQYKGQFQQQPLFQQVMTSNGNQITVPVQPIQQNQHLNQKCFQPNITTIQPQTSLYNKQYPQVIFQQNFNQQANMQQSDQPYQSNNNIQMNSYVQNNNTNNYQ
eukprot:403360975